MASDKGGRDHQLERVLHGKDIHEVCKGLLAEVKRTYRDTQKLNDSLLSSLQFVFQGPLLSALELVERCAVTELVSPSNRRMFQIIGDSGTPYVCFPNLKYCSCPAYNFSVLHKEDHIVCKHVLAMMLSEAMERSKRIEVTDDQISSLIQSID